MSMETNDLAILFGEGQAALRILLSIPKRLESHASDLKVREGNAEEKRIALAFHKSITEVAKAMDALTTYTWHTYVLEFDAKIAQDAICLAECESRKEYGEALEVLCVERLPTEYQTQRRWRVTMREPGEKDGDD